MAKQSKGSTVALRQLWLALKPTCAFSVGGLVSWGRCVHVPLLDVIHGRLLLQQGVVKTHQGRRLSTPFPQTGSRALAMLFARNGLKRPRDSARSCGNKCSWLSIFSSSTFPPLHRKVSPQAPLFEQSYQDTVFTKAVNVSRPVPRTQAVTFRASQSFSACEQATRVSTCRCVLR